MSGMRLGSKALPVEGGSVCVCVSFFLLLLGFLFLSLTIIPSTTSLLGVLCTISRRSATVLCIFPECSGGILFFS